MSNNSIFEVIGFKEDIDESIRINGIKNTREKYLKFLEETKNFYANKDIYIFWINEILDYINSIDAKVRDEKISSILDSIQ